MATENQNTGYAWTRDAAMECLDDLFAAGRKFIEKDDGSELPPVCHLLAADPDQPEGRKMLSLVADSFKDDDDKNRFAAMVRSVSMSLGAEYVILVTEAWMKHAVEGEDLKDLTDEHGCVEKMPGRDEILMAKLDGIGGFNAMATAIIETKSDGSRSVGEAHIYRSDNDGDLRTDRGRFSDLSMRQADN